MIDRIRENLAYHSNRMKEVSSEDISSLLDAPSVSLGVYGMEIEAGSEDVYLITPSMIRLQEESEEPPWNDNGILPFYDLYYLYPENPSFLPFYTGKVKSLVNQLQSWYEPSSVILQFLFQKCNNEWKETFVDQYEEFMNGQNAPSHNPYIRSVQRSLLHVLNRISGTTPTYRQAIPDIEQKILDSGFRWEGRLLIRGKNKEEKREALEKVERLLQAYDHLNGFRLMRASGKKKYQAILKRQFTGFSRHHIMSRNEIRSFLTEAAAEAIALPPITNDYVAAEPYVIDVDALIMERINQLPEGDLLPTTVDESKADVIVRSMEQLGLGKDFELLKVERGPTLQKFHFYIPSSLKFTTIKKETENLQVAIGAESLGIEAGEQANTVCFTISCEDRGIVHLGRLLREPDFHLYSQNNHLPFVCGVNTLGEPVYASLTDMRHILFCGSNGSGKSVWARQMIATLLMMHEPSELSMYLIDPKRVEFSLFESFPHVQKVVTEMAYAEQVLFGLVNEMEKRYTFLQEEKYRDVLTYNADHPDNKLPYIVCVVDEFSDLKMQYPDVEDYIQRLGQKARAAGIHLVIGTQYPRGDVISMIIKSNMPAKICFSLQTPREYQTVFGEGIGYRLLGKGDGVAKIEGAKHNMERFQAPVIELDQKKETFTLESLSNMYEESGRELSLEIREDVDLSLKLKRIIKTTRETRITRLQKLMKIRTNDLQELMGQLVEEGFLIKHASKTKGYELTASEEELAELEDWEEDE